MFDTPLSTRHPRGVDMALGEAAEKTTLGQNKTIVPSPTLHEATPLNRSKLEDVPPPKVALVFCCMWDFFICILCVPYQIDPWDIFFLVKFVQVLEQ
jgi:hypothetical protein